MGTNIIPISNVINVTLEGTPQGLAEKNVNNVLLLTNEPSNSSNPFDQYVSASQVATDFGTDSMTAKMANNIFAQSPNLRTGNGQLTIATLHASVAATRGQFVTSDISANLAAFQAVNNGTLLATIDGTAHQLANMNFTNCQTLVDVAAVIEAALLDCNVANVTNTLVFKSKRGGTTSTVALAAGTGGTSINGAGYLDVSEGVATPGVNSSGETILAAITRLAPLVSFTPVHTNMLLEDAAILTIASGVQALDNHFHYASADYKAIAGIGTTIAAAGQTRTRLKVYTPDPDSAVLENAAYVGRAYSVNFNGSNTSQTMFLKTLANVVPDGGITQTLYDAAKLAGVDLYVSFDGVPGVLSSGGNDFFDNVYNDTALKYGLETAGFNFLRQTNTKVPQTEQGMNGLKGAYAGVMQRFVFNGCIAPGSWQSSETFGDPVIFNQNILSNGYYIYSLPIVQQNQTEREERIAPLVQIACKRAGAIQESDVIVLVND